MPLSYVCILGGMTTLIGSSTNLLVANAAACARSVIRSASSNSPFRARFLAGVGIVYTLLAVPRLLPGSAAPSPPGVGQRGRRAPVLAQLDVTSGHPLEGMGSIGGLFPGLRDITVLKHRAQRPGSAAAL
jgi:hypothetical protein